MNLERKRKKEKGVICALSFECTVSRAKRTESAHHHFFFLFVSSEGEEKKNLEKKRTYRIFYDYILSLYEF